MSLGQLAFEIEHEEETDRLWLENVTNIKQ